MPSARKCVARNARGEPCKQAPIIERDRCFWHDPEYEEDAIEARRLGRQRQKRESVVSTAYDFDGLGSVKSIRRLVEVAVADTLELSNSVARNRTLAYLAQTATKLLEVGEHEDRLQSLERALSKRLERNRRR